MFSYTEIESVGSTNTWLLEKLAQEDLPDMFAVMSLNQTSGRGRMNRVWFGSGGIALSVLAKQAGANVTWLPLIVGTAVAAAVNRLLPAETVARVKWPNDVLVDGKKLAGILMEADANGRGTAIGVGLNFEQAPLDRATSLRALGVEQSAQEVTESVLQELRQRYEQLLALGDEPFKDSALFEEVTAACMTINSRVRVTGGISFEGLAQRLDGSGQLVVSNGQETVVVAVGDIEHLYHAD